MFLVLERADDGLIPFPTVAGVQQFNGLSGRYTRCRQLSRFDIGVGSARIPWYTLPVSRYTPRRIVRSKSWSWPPINPDPHNLTFELVEYRRVHRFQPSIAAFTREPELDFPSPGAFAPRERVFYLWDHAADGEVVLRKEVPSLAHRRSESPNRQRGCKM